MFDSELKQQMNERKRERLAEQEQPPFATDCKQNECIVCDGEGSFYAGDGIDIPCHICGGTGEKEAGK